MHTAPGACLLYAVGAVCYSIMVLDHIQLKIFSLEEFHQHVVLAYAENIFVTFRYI